MPSLISGVSSRITATVDVLFRDKPIFQGLQNMQICIAAV
jgi:hypothetical protein